MLDQGPDSVAHVNLVAAVKLAQQLLYRETILGGESAQVLEEGPEGVAHVNLVAAVKLAQQLLRRDTDH